MDCKITLIRHGLTYWNVQKKMQGQVNIPLNDEGVRQAIALSQELSECNFDICYSSPLSRAYETARIVIAERKTSIIADNRLIEHGYGLLEGESYRQSQSHPRPEKIDDYERHPERYVPPIGGETFEEVHERAKSFLENVLVPAASTHDSILVAAHGGINCAIMGCMFDIPVEKFWSVRQRNCGFTIIGVEGDEFKVLRSTPIETEF